MNHIYDMIIIGGGPAGYTAALYAARAGFDTVVVEKYSPGGQMALTGDIENYPGFEEGIDGFSLGMKMQQSAERFGVETKIAEFTKVSLKDAVKTLETTEGPFSGRTVMIAAGANHRPLGLGNSAVHGDRDLWRVRRKLHPHRAHVREVLGGTHEKP